MIISKDTAQKKAKILIADDNCLQRLLLAQIFEQAGHEVVLAEDGEEAVQLFIKEIPDLVVLDIFMPKMDGIEVATRIQKVSDDKYVPLVFITGSNNDDQLQRCIDVGADDFVYKPFNALVLRAKVDSLLRVQQLYQQQYSQKQKLLEFQHQVAQEQEIAMTLYKNIVHTGFYDTPEVKYLLSPMALFNGDIFLVAKTPGNQLYALLGDFTGHGLAASVGAGPVAEIFYGMAEKGFGSTEIIVEINRKMDKLLPVNMFLAATIVVFFPDARVMSLITCGLPDHYLFNHKTKQLQTISSKNLPLGIIESFEPHVQNLPISKNSFLYLFTDGVIEAENTLGKQFDALGVIHSIENNTNGYAAVLHALDEHTKGMGQQDDITFVELDCNIADPKWIQTKTTSTHKQLKALSWKSSIEFDAATLRYINPVPVVINSIMEIQGLIEHREAIFLIVTELFANALDHGLLELDSKMKQTSAGFMQYYRVREERLAQLSDGYIKMSFNHQPTDTGGKLVIRMQDSGQGFDFSNVSSDLEQNQQNFGRGISLLLNLCKGVEYSGNGNRVQAVYDWTV
ncbi:MAG: SpoIIE family protein phosphatase [Methyloprofundus sp.]|nr:SpoIIE family protein phosphatase [Methyloprofundus sp.]